MKKKADLAMVETARATLQLLVSKPSALFDPYATLAALEQLVDSAREVGDERAKRHAIILRQCRPLVHNSAMQSVLIKLVADKEEAEVAKVIDKTIRRQPGVGNRDARALGRTRWSRPGNRDFTNQNTMQPETSPEVICSTSASLRMLGAEPQRVFFTFRAPGKHLQRFQKT